MRLDYIRSFINVVNCKSFSVAAKKAFVSQPTISTHIKQLEADGWFLVRVRGSHHQFKHPSKPGLVTVKHPDSDIPAGTFNSIRKQAGWK